MDLNILKTYIRDHPQYHKNREVLHAFNQYVTEHGRAPGLVLPLSDVAKILGIEGEEEIRTYSQHVRFAKAHGFQQFRYRSSKTGRSQLYVLDAEGVQFTKR